MLPSVMKRFLQSAVNRMHLPSTSMFGRCSSTAAPHLEENISKSFVTGPLTMLSEEEEMMKETGNIFFIHSQLKLLLIKSLKKKT